MESLSQEFVNYLHHFGLVESEIGRGFKVLCMNRLNKGITQLKEGMCIVLSNYLSNLTDDKRRKICMNIVNKFLLTNNLFKLSSISSIILKHNTKANLLIKLKAFHIWKQFSFSKRNIQIIKSHRRFSSNKEHNTPILSNFSHFETSWEEKERKELEHCTFRPKTNHSRSIIFTSPNTHRKPEKKIPIYERLYQDSDKYKSRKQLKANKFEQLFSVQNTFHPEINSPKNDNIRKKNFNERQKIFIDKISKHKEDIINKLNDSFNKNCSFSPKVNRSRKYTNPQRENTPVGERLYADSKERQNKSLRTLEEKKKKIDEQCNSFLYQRNRDPYGNFDSQHIADMYNKYKSKQMQIESIKRTVDKEEGITFQPFLNKDNKYYGKIQTNIHERTENLIANKKKFVDKHKAQQDLNYKMNVYGYKEKEYSQYEKEQITKRIVERLYGKVNDKSKRNECNEGHLGKKKQTRKEHNFPFKKEKEDLKENKDNEKEIEIEYSDNDDEDKYCDRIIRIDEYTLGKLKRQRQQSNQDMERGEYRLHSN